MRNVYEVLRDKEAQLRQVQIEVEALRLAAPLLADESEAGPELVSRGNHKAEAKGR
jgi:hypothetical protein